MKCRAGGECELVSREIVYTEKAPGVAQCLKCSTVYQADNWRPRHCDHCNKDWGESLHDPCLGTIEGANEVCCGHGDPDKAYANFNDGRHLRGSDLPWL